jgi:hypothetical protein
MADPPRPPAVYPAVLMERIVQRAAAARKTGI